jgi:hypothetical protein
VINLSAGRRRLLGVGLTAYGLLGLAAAGILVIAALAVGPALQSTLDRVDGQRDAVVAGLESSASAIERSADLAVETAGALGSSGEIASEAANISRLLADALSRLAGTFGSFEVLGNQPFAPLASDATQLAAQLRGVAIDLDALGIRLAKIGRGIPALAEDLQATSDRLEVLADDLADLAVPESSTTVLAWLVVGFALLVAWLVVPAVVALAVGIALLRPRPDTT